MFRKTFHKVLAVGRSGWLSAYGLIGLLGMGLVARAAESALILWRGGF
ncbi:MAG: hypothetical protein IT562_13355 [Alphaproteobacteria bacterium]|nr:hypothetical protein [Alphaproteobacteria bacterium]